MAYLDGFTTGKYGTAGVLDGLGLKDGEFGMG